MGYTIIQHDLRKQFHLTMNEYAVLDSVYTLSRGCWCTAGKETLGEFLGLTKQTVHSILNTLESMNLIKRNKGWIKTTEIWDKEFVKNKTGNSKESLLDSKESLPKTVKNLYSNSKESLHNNYNNNIDNNINNKEMPPAVIDTLYALYPARCPISNRSTGKCSKNKLKLASLLKNGQNEQGLKAIMQIYIAGCRETNTYMKNFSTFLNNLPDLEEIKKTETDEALENTRRFVKEQDEHTARVNQGRKDRGIL